MRTDLIIAGVGGQGSLMAGTLLGTAAVVFDNKKALQTQSYSSELRGERRSHGSSFPMRRSCIPG